MDFEEIRKISNIELTLEKAKLLEVAKPPYSSGVYALFFESQRVYVGVARGKKGLRNRKRNYVGGDERHTTHRQFIQRFPEKSERTAFILKNVSMAWFEIETAQLAEETEVRLISLLKPAWNRIGKKD
ncbi:hypothetical protein HKX54_06540 [Sulfitobacter sp. M57]|uniref:hypothetical protein n=1 Tax=unclassified Sulfitobacter TaxID=196795 RepID=UPI0023E163CA|nr:MULTISPECIES: hypothetical protein [unclassified Sulfitobacter]MDF3414106.1 hypothetical protein [Sulfitobacter sp. KE5]MDF3420613.1 hypothetical protein [Sulfitobacter sp. KE43]MDF3432652.1 hypothetical protein [Sulfitobacter sp. KE42]MDF3458291.1 hypothetical protein [Sulfitobacter sp. S74]MDF3462192.1 hypothetical protein [Sulfitobacter sp. Ks18]